MKQEHIDTLTLFRERSEALVKVPVIDSRADAALLSMYYGVPPLIGLTLFEAGVRDRVALADGLVYHLNNNHEQQGRPESPQFALFKQIALFRSHTLSPSKIGRGNGKGNSALLIDVLDNFMGDEDSLHFASFQLGQSVTIERKREDINFYRFKWDEHHLQLEGNDEEFTDWVTRDYLQQRTLNKALIWLKDTAEEASKWL